MNFSVLLFALVGAQSVAHAEDLPKVDPSRTFDQFLEESGKRPQDLFRILMTKSICLADADHYRGCFAATTQLAEKLHRERLRPANFEDHAGDSLSGIEVIAERSAGRFFWDKIRERPVFAPRSALKAAQLEAYQQWSTLMDEIWKQESQKVTLPLWQVARSLLAESQQRERDAIRALREYYTYSLRDPHVWIRSRAEVAEQTQSPMTIPEYQLGFSFVREPRGFRVTEVRPEGPAELRGLREGDLIQKVNGVSATLSRLQTRRGNSPGDPCRLTLERTDGARAVELTIVARKSADDYVTSELRVDGSYNRIGYIRLRTFVYENACRDVVRAVVKLQKANATAWVLDLRGNGGGDVPQMTCIAGIFLDGKRELFRMHEVKNRRVVGTGAEKFPPSLQIKPGWLRDDEYLATFGDPLVVLIDEGTASASELLAASLRFWARSLNVGLRSYGKASGMKQSPEEMADFQTSLYLTSHLMLFPDGSTYHTRGVRPDFEVSRGSEFPFQREDHSDSEANRIPPPLIPNAPDINYEEPGHEGAALRACVRTFDLQRWYSDERFRAHLPDTQRKLAEVVLDCWIKLNYPVRGY